jgi:threonyl-tRNA synthetase
VVLPVAEAQGEAAREAARELTAHGVRVRVDARAESLARRVLEAHERATPFVIVIGERERRGGRLTLRSRSEQRVLPSGEAIAELVRAVAAPI